MLDRWVYAGIFCTDSGLKCARRLSSLFSCLFAQTSWHALSLLQSRSFPQLPCPCQDLIGICLHTVQQRAQYLDGVVSNKSHTPISRNSAMAKSSGSEGWLKLVHHLETVCSLTSIYCAKALFFTRLSARNALIRLYTRFSFSIG